MSQNYSPEDTSEADLLRAATDPATNLEVLADLSRSDYEIVRVAVVNNPSTPRGILDTLVCDRSSWVRSAVERRAMCEAATLSIHPTAIVSPGATIGSDVSIGPYSIIHANARIGAGTIIGSHCEIGHPAHNPADRGPLEIGENSLIRSHSIFYEGSTFGDNLITGHRVTVREKTVAGRNFQIGTLGDIQGHCRIGDFVRFHSNVHIGQKSTIGNYVWIFPYVVLTNDPHPPSEIMLGVTVEDYVAIATMSIVLPGVTIKEGALVGAHSSVAKNVDADTVVAGAPAKFICETSKVKLKDGSGQSAYPWRRHFHRGYLPDAVEKWIKEFQ